VLKSQVPRVGQVKYLDVFNRDGRQSDLEFNITATQLTSKNKSELSDFSSQRPISGLLVTGVTLGN
jgi:hypothetical protein